MLITKYPFVLQISKKLPLSHHKVYILPLSLLNAPKTFQIFMHAVFLHALDKFIPVYLDNILVFSTNVQQHM